MTVGRWYRAPDLNGPCAFVASRDLPADFKQILPQNPAGVVLAAVAGMPQAREAVIANTIPQTATIPRKGDDGPAFTAALYLSLILAFGTAQSADAGPRPHAQGAYDTVSATYLVVAGDDLFAISERFEVPMDAIKAHNNMASSDVKIGQKLKIGGCATHSAATKKPVSRMICEDFLVLDEWFQPQAVSLAVAYGSNGQPEAEAPAMEGVGTVTRYIVEECKKAPKESFWQKAQAEYKKRF